MLSNSAAEKRRADDAEASARQWSKAYRELDNSWSNAFMELKEEKAKLEADLNNTMEAAGKNMSDVFQIWGEATEYSLLFF